jgi:hypothetical protein
MARVHYRGSSTFCCSSENPCEEHLKKFPPDPAQSAPSAEAFRVLVWHKDHPVTDKPMDCDEIAQFAEAYAALRTAQLEDDLRQARLNAASHQHSARTE